MNGTPDVNESASVARPTIATRYPVDRIKLLEAIQARRGDDHLSDTVSAALDRMIEEHFPDALKAS